MVHCIEFLRPFVVEDSLNVLFAPDVERVSAVESTNAKRRFMPCVHTKVAAPCFKTTPLHVGRTLRNFLRRTPFILSK